ncbi:hypothetical protein [Streptomyces meridianus]|uniref:Uncharacterized protein n=1 Tax=Streptomyces meridianus TaxID=2938945 RepID=A0ABT0X5W4_9ACTN|nr:hypothetical protein [Streptomyces meridianus]MCM2577929.1 hypothetical protein [Streptomyces meridianus]
MTQRFGTLLVPVPGLSGKTYPAGTPVAISGRGASVDAFVGGDWLPLTWWEFAEGHASHGEALPES